MRKEFANCHGFTLVEIIVTLMLVGLLASISGLGVAWSMRSYTTTRENVAIAQKAQLALSRINKELSVLSDIVLDNTTDSSNGTCIIYKVEYKDAPLPYNYRIIRHNSGTDKLEYISPTAACTSCNCSAPGNTHTLADNIGSASISYQAPDDTTITSGGPTYAPGDIGSIKVTLKFERSDSSLEHEFSVTVSPRNNGNRNAPGFAS